MSGRKLSVEKLVRKLMRKGLANKDITESFTEYKMKMTEKKTNEGTLPDTFNELKEITHLANVRITEALST